MLKQQAEEVKVCIPYYISLEMYLTLLQASEFIAVPAIPALSNIKLGTYRYRSQHKTSDPVFSGLAGEHQYQNATLAVHLAKKFLTLRTGEAFGEDLPSTFVEGLQSTKWPGRCQTVTDPAHEKTTWFLDGAHTLESLDCCMQWFVSPDAALRSSEDL